MENITTENNFFKNSECRITSLDQLKQIVHKIDHKPYPISVYLIFFKDHPQHIRIHHEHLTNLKVWKAKLLDIGYVIGWKGMQNDILNFAAWIIKNKRQQCRL